jgi:hypothetical protein
VAAAILQGMADRPGLTPAEHEHQTSWALLARIAVHRGAGAALPGRFPPDVEAEYQRLRKVVETLRDQPDPAAHEPFRQAARALLERIQR